MNLFLTGEFKQCKTGKRVLEDYLKNYNQFNQGLRFYSRASLYQDLIFEVSLKFS